MCYSFPTALRNYLYFSLVRAPPVVICKSLPFFATALLQVREANKWQFASWGSSKFKKPGAEPLCIFRQADNSVTTTRA